jgi:hypothetical protein
MAVGTSGRVVVEIDPELKRELYTALAREGLNLKVWFLRNIDSFLADQAQLRLALSDNDSESIKAGSK